jgi:hypothetical protein
LQTKTLKSKKLHRKFPLSKSSQQINDNPVKNHHDLKTLPSDLIDNIKMEKIVVQIFDLCQ